MLKIGDRREEQASKAGEERGHQLGNWISSDSAWRIRRCEMGNWGGLFFLSTIADLSSIYVCDLQYLIR